MQRILLALFVTALTAGFAEAAVTANSTVSPQLPKLGVVQFTSASSFGTYSTLYTAGADGSKCSAIVATTDDGSAAHVVTIQVVRSATKYGGTAVNVPISSGFANGVPPVNFMSTAVWPGLPLDSEGNPFLFLQSGDTLQATFATPITSAKLLNIIAVCADF